MADSMQPKPEGELSSQHLISWLLRSLQSEQLVQLREGFQTRPNGQLTMDAFVACVSRILEGSVYQAPKSPTSNTPGGFVGVPDGRGPAPPGAEQSVVDTLLTLFGQLDADGDGLISWNDFGSCILETSATRVRTTKSYLERPALEIWKKAEVDKAIYVPGWRKTVHCTKDKVVNIYHSPSGNPYMEYHGHQASVLTACYIPEIGKLATSGADRQIIVWHEKHGTPLVELDAPVPQLCLCYDRARPSEDAVSGSSSRLPTLLSGGLDGTIRFWDLDTKREAKGVLPLEGHTDWVTDLMRFEHVHMIASASLDKTIRIWDMNSHQCRYIKKGHAKGVLSLAYSVETRLMLSIGYGKEVLVWNPFTQYGPIHKLKGHDKQLVGLACIPGSTEIVTCDASGKVMIWDTRTYSCIQVLGGAMSKHTVANATAFCCDTDANQIVTYGKQMAVYRSKEAVNHRLLQGRLQAVLYNSIFQVIVIPVGSNINVYSATTGALQTIHDRASNCDITCLVFTARERELLFSNLEGRVKVMSLVNGFILQNFQLLHEEMRTIYHVERDPRRERRLGNEEPRIALIVTNSRRMFLIDYQKPNEERIMARIDAAEGAYLSAFSPKDNALVLLYEGGFEVWSLDHTQVPRVRIKLDCAAAAATFVDSQNCFITGDVNMQIKIWSSANYALVVQYSLSAMVPVSLSYCHALRTLVVADRHRIEALDFEAITTRFFERHMQARWNYSRTEDGVLFQGRYYVESAMPGLGNSMVKAALNLNTHQKVELRFAADPAAFQTPLRIYAALKRVKPRFVCQIYDHYPASDDSKYAALVTELAQKSLPEHLLSPAFEPGSLPHVIECLVRALQELHAAGVVFGDVCPAKVVKCGEVWKLGDLGAARLVGEALPNCFAPHHCPPEMARWKAGGMGEPLQAHPSYDVWALGVTIHELVGPQKLFGGMPDDAVFALLRSRDLPAHLAAATTAHPVLKEVLLHTLVPDPEQRWGIDEVAEYLEDVGYSSGFVVPEQELRPFPKSIPRDVQVVNIQQPRLGSPDLKPRPGSPQGLEVVEEGQDGALAAEKFAYISAASVNENPCVYFVAEYLGSSSAVKVFNLDSGVCCGQLPLKPDEPHWDVPPIHTTVKSGNHLRHPKNISQLASYVDHETQEEAPLVVGLGAWRPLKSKPPPEPSSPTSAPVEQTSHADRISPFFVEWKKNGHTRDRVLPFYVSGGRKPPPYLGDNLVKRRGRRKKPGATELHSKRGSGLALEFLNCVPYPEGIEEDSALAADLMADKPKKQSIHSLNMDSEFLKARHQFKAEPPAITDRLLWMSPPNKFLTGKHARPDVVKSIDQWLQISDDPRPPEPRGPGIHVQHGELLELLMERGTPSPPDRKEGLPPLSTPPR